MTEAWVEPEERWESLVEQERLERRLTQSREFLRLAPSLKQRDFWLRIVRQDEFALRVHNQSRTTQTVLVLA